MQKPSDEQLAKDAYNWLRVSPIFTVFTLFTVAGMGFSQSICFSDFFDRCGFETHLVINFGSGILVSSLWHLLLLRFLTNKKSEFVRRHGQKALVYAGIRTAVPLSAIILDYFIGAGLFTFTSIIILVVLWSTNTKAGLQEIARELKGDKRFNESNSIILSNTN